MSVGLLGRKVGMTQLYDETGKVIPVTVIQAGPCSVLQVKTAARDGYEAVQLGYLDKPRRLASRSARGHVAKLDSKGQRNRAAAGVETLPKAGCEPQRFIREFRDSGEGMSVGDKIEVDIFQPTLQQLPSLMKELAGNKKIDMEEAGWEEELKKKHKEDYWGVVKSIKSVDVIGVSKGRGTAGAMKRHNFAGQRASHGVKKCHRHLGGTGCSASPSRLFKGRRMAGRYGNARCTMRNLKVVQVDADNHLLVVRGAVPGPNGGFVMIRETNKL